MGFDKNKFELFLIRQGLSDKTVREHMLRVGRVMGDSGVITEDSANSYILNMIKGKKHPSTINKHIQAIRKYCDFNKLSWVTDVKKLREPKPVRVLLSEKEIETFINADLNTYHSLSDRGSKYKIYWSIIAYSGARPSEILNLTIDDIDLSQNVIYIKKSKTLEGRSIPISQIYLDDLKLYLKSINTKHLFSNYLEDKPLTHSSILKDLNQRKKELNIKKNIKPYTFRHSFITRLLNNDVPLFIVQDIVGHKTAETTRKYYHGNIKNMHDGIRKDSALQSRLSGHEMIKQVVDTLKKFSLESHPGIDPAKLQYVYAKLWESVKNA